MSTLTRSPSPRARGYVPLRLLVHRQNGVSAAARNGYQAASQVGDFGDRSYGLFGPKRAAISQVWALVRESRHAVAEPEEAEPISDRVADLAVEFIRALPDELPLPEFAWEPD